MLSPLLRKILAILAIAALVWLFARYLLPILSPFLLGGFLALAAEPLVRTLQKRLKLSRSVAAGIGVSISLILFLLSVMILAAFLVRQLQSLAGIVPDLGSTVMEGIDALRDQALLLSQRAPQSLRPMVESSVNALTGNGSILIDQLTSRLLKLASGIVSKLPDSALGFGTWLLASYMICAKLPKIQAFLNRFLAEDRRKKLIGTLLQTKKAVIGWLAAQCKLIGIAFCVLSLGFLLLQIRHWLLWAALIALVDALPVLGTGTVLIPWSIVAFLQGDTIRALGLLGIYTVTLLLRSILEPKIIGKQLGLDPLVTLIAMYTGYRLWGIVGMLLSPLLAVVATQLLTMPKNS